MNVLKVGIIGAAGQVGLALLKALNSDARFMAVGICRSSVSGARPTSRGLHVRIAQTNDAVQLTEVVRDLDVLVNCALPQYKPSKTSVANQRLADSLAKASAGKRLVHLSSVAVYGDFIPGRRILFNNPKPDTAYGRQKLQMEGLLRALARKHSVKCTILRVGHVYGPELGWSKTFFDIITKVRFRLPFDGKLLSNAVGIQNLTEGIRYVLLSDPSDAVLNLTDTPQTTWRDIFDLHSRASGHSPLDSLSFSESQRLFRDFKKRAETGMTARLAQETWHWALRLPTSYIAAVPTFKAIWQWAAGKIGSETLDARLWAFYCKRFSSVAEVGGVSGIPPIFLSEPVPGPCLAYQGSNPVEIAAELESWYGAISTPLAITHEAVR